MVDILQITSGESTPALEEEQAVKIANRLQTDSNFTLVNLIETLGPALTDTRVDIRRSGLSVVSHTLVNISPSFLHGDDLALLAAFYTDRLRDHHSLLPTTLQGLATLAASHNLTREGLAKLLDSLFREVMLQQQVVADRAVVYRMLASLLSDRLEDIRQLATQFTVGLLQASEGEKDPRNLVTVFSLFSSMLSTLDLDHLREDVFEALAVYFPVDFTPPRGVKGVVTKEELVLGLRDGLSHPSVAEWTIGLLLEKLDSDLESAKLDSLLTMQKVASRCSPTELEMWAREVEGVWSALKRETIGIRLQPSAEVQAEARMAVRAVSKLLGSQVTSGALSLAWDRWITRVWADCMPHLEMPNTRLYVAVGDLLCEVAVAGRLPAREVLTRALPKLLEDHHKVEGEAKAASLVAIGQLLVAAAEGVRHNGGAAEEQPGVGAEIDKAVALLLTVVQSGGESGVGAGVRLGRASAILSPSQRLELTQALVAGVNQGEEGLGEGLAELARVDPTLARDEIVPRVLDITFQGLGAVSRLWAAGLYWDIVPGLLGKVSEGAHHRDMAAKLINLLAGHKLEGEDRKDPARAADILVSILKWETRPEGEKMDKVMADLGEILTAEHCQQVGEELDRQPDAVAPLLLSVSSNVMDAWPSLVSRAMSEGQEMWKVKAALVNRKPSLAPSIAATPGEEVAWLAAGLARRGDGSAGPWIDELVKQVGEGNEEAVEGIGRLLSPPWWRNSTTGLLFKQRTWTQLYPVLSGPASNAHHMAALVLLLPHLPKPLLEPKLPALLPLVVRALSAPATALHALNCLSDFVAVDVALLVSHLQEVVEHCLTLAEQGSLQTRTRALQVLTACGSLEGTDRVLLAPRVTKKLGAAVKDRKRVVRVEAARARNTWFLVTQP